MNITKDAWEQISYAAFLNFDFENNRMRPPEMRVSIEQDNTHCMEFRYRLDWDETKNDDDIEYKHPDGMVVRMSRKDYDEVLNSATLVRNERFGGYVLNIENPKHKIDCGCGRSFNIK